MKSTPILFSGPMIRAIREDRKTQTRRVCELQDDRDYQYGGAMWSLAQQRARCSYGGVGDRLWVRETWYGWGRFEKTGNLTETGKPEMTFVWPETREAFAYALDGKPTHRPAADARDGWHKRPSIFMPRAFSRLTLELLSVCVERVQDISEADALAEGINKYLAPYPFPAGWPQNADGKYTASYGVAYSSDRSGFAASARGAFAALWDGINAARGWEIDPLVWVLEFKRA